MKTLLLKECVWGPVARLSKTNEQARLVERLLYFRCWQLAV